MSVSQFHLWFDRAYKIARKNDRVETGAIDIQKRHVRQNHGVLVVSDVTGKIVLLAFPCGHEYNLM